VSLFRITNNRCAPGPEYQRTLLHRRLPIALLLLVVATNVRALSFAPQVSYELSETTPAGIAAADFNNDGYGDLAITMSGADGGVGSVSILLGDGTGAFPSHNQLTASDVDGLGYTPWGIAAADFNNDGNQDLVVTAYGAGVYRVSVYLNDGNGLFVASDLLATVSQSPSTVVTGFFNNDAHVDIATGSDSGTGAGVSVFFGVGDGTFGNANPITASTSLSVKDMVTADFNLDGDTDLITTRQVLLNDGNGVFSVAGITGGNTAVAVSAFDINRDGRVDIVLATSTSIDIWRNDQNGSLIYVDTYDLASGNITALASTDFDNNGDPDIVVSDYTNSQVHVYQGLGDGSFALPESFTTGAQPKTVIVADWSGDGAADIAAAYRNGGETPYASVLIQVADTTPPPTGSFQFSSATYSVAENSASLTVTVSRVAGSAGAVSVDYASADGSATAGNDYSVVSGTLDFAAGQISQTIVVSLLDDASYEGNENFTLSLSNATGGASVAAPATTTITILENDPAPQPGSLQFGVNSYSVTEIGVNVNITVTRTGGSSGLVSVDYASSDASATAASDYTAVSGRLNFDDGVVSRSFTVSILDDTVYEGSETFTIRLSNVSGGAVLGAITAATVTITENDPVPPAGALHFSVASYSVAENAGTALVTVVRNGGSFGEVSVNYVTSNGTANAGSDYTATSGTLTFVNGVTSQTITLQIADDAEYEGNETIFVSLASVIGGVSLIAPTTATLTIVENDPVPPAGSLQFSGASYSVSENNSNNNVVVTVTRTGGSSGQVTADFMTSDGTAIAGDDYTAQNGTLTFDDGVTSQTITILINDDQLFEGNENFNIRLSSVSGGASLSNPSATVVNILENDPVPLAGSLQFSGSTYSLAEDGNSLLVTVTRAGGSFGSVTVSYVSGDGTATAGSDFTVVSGTLTFSDGVTSQTFEVPVIDDQLFEIDESFAISLLNPTNGAVLGQPAAATVTIMDDSDPASPPSAPSTPARPAKSGGGSMPGLFLLLMATLMVYRRRGR